MAVAGRGIGGFSRAGIVAAAMLCAFAATAEETASLQVSPELSRAEYERVSREIRLSAERMKELTGEIAAVKKDQASITAALIQSAKTEKKLGQDIEDISSKLEGLKEEESGLKSSLAARRSVLAEVLGALQRMGLNPPPAILVKPEDALASVRSAVLLGAVVPELRQETEILIADLAEMSRVAASIEGERARLTAAVGEQLAEKERLGLLIAEKQKLRGDQEAALAAEQRGTEKLADRAKSLKELIASLESRHRLRKRIARPRLNGSSVTPNSPRCRFRKRTGSPHRRLSRPRRARFRCL